MAPVGMAWFEPAQPAARRSPSDFMIPGQWNLFYKASRKIARAAWAGGLRLAIAYSLTQKINITNMYIYL
jgi:hypothetical protein